MLERTTRRVSLTPAGELVLARARSALAQVEGARADLAELATVTRCDRGDPGIVALQVVLAECVFVLESFYGHSRADIASALGRLISSPDVEITEVTVHLDALNCKR